MAASVRVEQAGEDVEREHFKTYVGRAQTKNVTIHYEVWSGESARPQPTNQSNTFVSQRTDQAARLVQLGC
eukprot:5333996-Pyramimonas_sp.AAC.1